MLEGAAAALCRKPRRLVEHDRRSVLCNDHAVREVQLLLGQFALRLRPLVRLAARRDAQGLARFQPVLRLDPLAVHPDLPGPRPARDGGESDLRQVALEPAIEANAVIIRRDAELANLVHFVLFRSIGHAATRIRNSPSIMAATPPATDTSA
jgi:hypothetical protein